MKQYGDVVTMMHEFLSEVEAEQGFAKRAADDDAKKEAEGKTSKVIPNMQAGQGAAGKEKQQDLNAGVPGIEADSPQAENNDSSKQPYDDQGPKTLDASQKVTEVKLVNTPEKIARAERLGNDILRIIGEMRKTAAEQQQAESDQAILAKLAAQNQAFNNMVSQASHDFAVGYLEGQAQRAQDRAELLASGLVKTAEEADAVLDQVAQEDPAGIAPPEIAAAAPPVDAEGGDEDAAEQLAAQLDAAGIAPEELADAAEKFQELTEAGVDPEEIADAAAELAGEEASGEGPMPEELVDAAAAEAPTLEEKVAIVRHEAIKDYIRGLSSI